MTLHISERAKRELLRLVATLTDYPAIPALVWAADQHGESHEWMVGFYDSTRIPTDMIVDAGGFSIVVEPHWRGMLADKRLDFLNGSFEVKPEADSLGPSLGALRLLPLRMKEIRASFSLTDELRHLIAARGNAFATATVPAIILAAQDDDVERLHLGFYERSILTSEDPIFLVTFDDGFELVIIQEDLLGDLEGRTLGLERGRISVS